VSVIHEHALKMIQVYLSLQQTFILIFTNTDSRWSSGGNNWRTASLNIALHTRTHRTH